MQKITIALVDKQHLFRSALKSLLHTEPSYSVIIEAANAHDFTSKVNRQFPPDLVLLDLDLPLADGFDTIYWIRENCPRSRVIVVSAHSEREVLLKAIRLGARGYLSKTTGFEELKMTIENVKTRGYYLNDQVSGQLTETLGETILEYHEMSPASSLTDREILFLKLSCTGLTYKEIAREMGVSCRTIDTYRDHLFNKLNVRNRVGLAVFALKNGISDY